MRPQIILLLLLGAVLCGASPAKMFFSSARRNSPLTITVTTVDCSNKQAVEFVAKTHANFRCVYPDQRPRSSVVTDSAANPMLFNAPVPQCQPGQIYDPDRRICTSSSRISPSGFQFGSVAVESPNSCPPGTLFASEVGMCLETNQPNHIAPLESANLIIDQRELELPAFPSEYQLHSDCEANEIYNSELGLCMAVNPPNPLEPLTSMGLVTAPHVHSEIPTFSSPVQTAADCSSFEMFVPEISACVSMSGPPPLESANLILSSFADSKLQSASDCGPGELFASEIGMCLSANPPRVQQPLVSDSLVRDISPAVPVQQITSCPAGEMYVAEIGICLPSLRPQTDSRPPPSSSLIREPVELEIRAFEFSKSFDDCQPGTIYVSEIGICM